ncbi:MFS transporter [Thalassotalea mangrovi]|uniref:MFS transporter n=1 Tax=Thalassotalea mangrovi TaxID=2572245 RepID=A0A4U1B728_9GAMM|nr:MFS transporter [Thalassotalea mangrovi]TKB46368.1 MFS transporter [Thalassotalea mangrovi]
MTTTISKHSQASQVLTSGLNWSGRIGYFALLWVAMMGAAVTTLMPLILGAFSESGLFSVQQVGWLTSADVAGILLSSASAFLWVRKVPWKPVVALTLAGFIAANGISTSLTDFTSLLVCRFVAGLCCGVSYAIALAALGDQNNSDKAFGDAVTLQVIYGTIGFAILPWIIQHWGYAGIFQFFNISLLITFVLVWVQFPRNQRTSSQENTKIAVSPVALIFFAIVCYYFAQGLIWAHLERIGDAHGISSTDIGLILSAGFGISALGSWLSGPLAKKIGRPASLYLTLVLQLGCIVALMLMNQANAWIIYAIATVIYQIFWSFVVPIMMAIFNDSDKSGRLIVFCISAFKLGLVAGPPVAGFILASHSQYHVIVIGAMAIVVSIVCCHLASKQIASRT